MVFECRSICRRALFLLLLAGSAAAQTPRPLHLPDLPLGLAGTINAIASQPDGGIILGGAFTMIDNVPRRNIARLHPDGTLDREWNPSVDGPVKALAIDARGDVYVGGVFAEAGALPRRNLARLSGHGEGATDPEWDPGSRVFVFDAGILTSNADGDLFVGGDIRPDDETQQSLAKFSGEGDGAMVSDWRPPVPELTSIAAMVADGRGAIYISVPQWGDECCLYKVSDHGSGGELEGSRPALGGMPLKLAVAADGSLYAGYIFGPLGYVRPLIRLASDQIDPVWNPPYSQGVEALTVDSSGAVYISLAAEMNQASRTVKLTRAADGSARTEWEANTRNVYALAASGNGSLYAGGYFDHSWEPAPSRLSLTRIATADGSAQETVDALVPGRVNAIAFQPNGGTIVGGDFDRAGTLPRNNLLRLTADDRLDPDWTPDSDIDFVYALAVDAESNVYAGGHMVPSSQPPIAKIEGSGSGAVDSNWMPPMRGLVGFVYALATDGNGGIYVGGVILGGSDGPPQIAKFSLSDAAVDPTWIPPPVYDPVHDIVVRGDAVYIGSGGYLLDPFGNEVYYGSIGKFSNTSGVAESGWGGELPGAPEVLALDADGSLYVGGRFTSGDADATTYVLKFTRDGAPDSGWNDTAIARDFSPRAATALALDADGDLYIGGNYLDSEETFLHKLSGATGSIVRDWDPSTDGTTIGAISVKPDGRLYLGGNFTTVSGQPRTGLAALRTTPARPWTHSRRPLPPILTNRPPRSPGLQMPIGTR